MADISYNKTTWVNGSTALNDVNLNNIEMGVDNVTKAINNKVDKVDGKGLSTHDFNDYYKNAIDNLQGEGGISVIELTNKNGTIASTQLGEINANPQNFAFKYSGKILLFAGTGSTTYQYCNNTTNSSDNNVMTTSTLLTIESSTGAYTITENVHNVVANSTDPVNGGDLTNIQVGSKVYSIPSGSNIEIDTELSETSENPVQNKSVTTAITSLRERKYDQNNFQLRDGDYTSYQKDLSRIYRTEFNENGEKTNVSYRIPVVKAGGSMGAGWKPFEGINLDGQNYVFWLNNYKFGTNEEYKHTSSNFDYAEIQDLMYNGFRYRTQTIINLDKLGFADSRGTLTDEIITMIKNGSNIVIIHGGSTYRDYTEDTNYYYFTCIDYKTNANNYWEVCTLRIGKNDNSLLKFYGDSHYFVDANSTTAAYSYLKRLKIGKTNYIVSYVKANPNETGTEDLTSLKVGSTVYNIPSGGGSIQFYKLSFNNIYLDSSNKYNITLYLSKSILDNLFSTVGLNLDDLKNNFSSYVGGQLLWGAMTDIIFSTFDDFYGRITIYNDSGKGANISYFKDGTAYFNYDTTPITISFNTYSYNSNNTEATFNYEIFN